MVWQTPKKRINKNDFGRTRILMNIGYACINIQLSYPQKYGGKEKGVKPLPVVV